MYAIGDRKNTFDRRFKLAPKPVLELVNNLFKIITLNHVKLCQQIIF